MSGGDLSHLHVSTMLSASIMNVSSRILEILKKTERMNRSGTKQDGEGNRNSHFLSNYKVPMPVGKAVVLKQEKT